MILKSTKPKALWTACFPPKFTPKIRKALPKMSAKSLKENRIYVKVKREWRRDLVNRGLWRCARCGGVPNKSPHHWGGRRSNLCRVEYFRASCDSCNIFAKEHPKEAIAEGWRAPVGIYKT